MTDEVQSRLSAFKSWFTASGGYIHPSVDYAFDLEQGVHMRVVAGAAPIPAHTLVLKCPHNLTLSALNAHDVPPLFQNKSAIKLPGNVLNEARPQFIAALYLVTQHQRRLQSPWKSYLDVLPDLASHGIQDGVNPGLGVIDPPYCWEAAEKQWLSGTQLEKGVGELESLWWSDWARWNQDVIAWALGEGIDISWHLVKWALTVLGSRAFSSSSIRHVLREEVSPILCSGGQNASILTSHDPDMLLYPGLDSLNHHPDTRNRWTHDAEGFGLVCNDEIGPGDQVWNPYGAKSNGQFLLSFGFCLENNPHDSFSLKCPSHVSPLAQLLADSEIESQPDGPHSTFNVVKVSPSTAMNNDDRSLRYAPDHMVAPSSDAAKQVFFVRSYSTSGKGPPGYPQSTSPPPIGTPWFSGFPIELLNVLTMSLVNAREYALVVSSPSTYSRQNVYSQLNGRAQIALTVLLLGRLDMELERLQQRMLPLALEDSGSTHATRLHQIRTYRTGQARILISNIDALKMRLRDVLGISKFQTEDEQTMLKNDLNNPKPTLMTLQSVFGLLREVNSADDTSDFFNGLAAVYDTLDLKAWRRQGFEEDIWTLCLCNIISATPSAGVPSDPGETGLYKAHRHWLDTLAQFYAKTNQSEITDDDKTIVEELRRTVRGIRRVVGDAGVWAKGRWSKGLISQCVRMVREESVVVGLSAYDYEALQMRESKDDTSTAGHDGKGEAPEDESIDEGIQIVAFYTST